MTHLERTIRRKAMADRVHNGETLGEVAGKYGVSMTTVRMAHEEFYPFESPKKGVSRPSTTVRILALLINTPLTLAEIAKRVDVKYQRVQELQSELQGVGIERRVSPEETVKNS